MKPGDSCRVFNLMGETAKGKISEVLDVKVSEFQANFMEADEATLWDYWRGYDVDPNEIVVVVQLGNGHYEYPESKVEVIDHE